MKRKIFSILFALVLVLSFSLMTAVPVAAATTHTVGEGKMYTTIQAAADNLTSGDTIVVYAGTYTENIVINTSNITLTSANGAAATTIAASTANMIIDVTAADVTIDGFTLQGDEDEGDRGIYQRKTGFTIKNNVFTKIANDNIIVESSGGAITSGTIDSNTLTGLSENATQYRVGILLEAYSDNDIRGVTISNNTVSAFGTADGTKDAKGIELAGGVATEGKGEVTAIVTGNNISACRDGLYLRGDLAKGTTEMSGANATANNNISGCNVGVILYWGHNSEFSLVSNNITNNIGYGIYLADDGSALDGVQEIKYNDISGNGDGMTNAFATVTTNPVATDNWWGNTNGPEHSGNTFNVASQGDTVSDNVDYVPWYDTNMTGTSFSPVKDTTADPDTEFSSIQAAVTAATADDIITAASGNYTEQSYPVIVDESVTLKSVSGAASTTIDAGAVANKTALEIQAKDVTIGGSGAGFTIIAGSNGCGIWVPLAHIPGADGLQILGNTFQTSEQGTSHGIWIEPMPTDTPDPFLIDGNDFSQAADWVDGGGQGACGTGILISNAYAGGIISNNTAAFQKYTWLTFSPEKWVSALEYGMDTADHTGIDGVSVYGNTVQNNQCQAVNFATPKGTGDSHAGTAANLVISATVNIYTNSFYDNGTGVRLDPDNTGTSMTGIGYIVINYNDIYDNTNTAAADRGSSAEPYLGVYNGQTTDVDAQYNYWSDPSASPLDPSGPAITTNARGTGDAVSTYVDYDPWLHTTQATVYPSGTRYYAYNWCDLTKGWNIWSTPIALDAQADTWGEYKALGTDLDLATGSNAYYFNASTPAWVSVPDDYELTPCDAIYINMASDNTSPILFSASYSAPSKTLYADWNLVSASYIDNMNTPTITNGTNAEDALASVYTVAGTNNTGYSMVVSPATGQTGWSNARGATIDTDIGTQTMLPCKGYWVLMTNGGTLGGAVFTPVSPLLP